jgi:HEAT repeat protein
VGALDHDDRLHRFAAVHALGEIIVPAALRRLAQRAFDPEVRIAKAGLEALEAYRDQSAFGTVMELYRDLCKRGDELQRRRAVQAVRKLRDRDSLLLLVDLLGTRPKEISDEAHDALVDLTKQDFGASDRRWRAWIESHQNERRVQWLIEALDHRDARTRKECVEELRDVTGLEFGFNHQAPRNEREQAASKWRQWWEKQSDPSKWP